MNKVKWLNCLQTCLPLKRIFSWFLDSILPAKWFENLWIRRFLYYLKQNDYNEYFFYNVEFNWRLLISVYVYVAISEYFLKQKNRNRIFYLYFASVKNVYYQVSGTDDYLKGEILASYWFLNSYQTIWNQMITLSYCATREWCGSSKHCGYESREWMIIV